MLVALKQGNGFSGRPVSHFLVNFSISFAPPKFRNGYIAFLYLPFSVVNEKVLRGISFPLPSSTNGISVYITMSRKIKTFLVLCATFTESPWNDSFLGQAQSKEEMGLICLNTEI